MKHESQSSHSEYDADRIPPVAPPAPEQHEQPRYIDTTARKGGGSRGRLIGTGLAVAGVAALAGYGGAWVQERVDDPSSSFVQSTNDGNAQMSGEEKNISEAVNKVSKSVVSVVTEVTSRSYFGMQVGEGAGTGVIVSENGYILTNKHVIDGASNIQIVTSDGTTYDKVKLVGTDPLNDIAFLKIDGARNLPVAEIGDSGSIRVAQQVVAIGNSLGQYQNTVTSGIISGKDRPVTAQSNDGVETLTGLLQTDAAINPGNSGGPLINTSGQVIGINTAIAAEAQGIGFAIPIDATKGMLKHLLKTGEAKRSYLGVNFISITPEVAKEFSLDQQKGAYVQNTGTTPAVLSGSPAEKAGIKEGDIILKLNDDVVGENGSMSNMIAEYAPGETVTLTVSRDGNERQMRVTLEEYNA